MPVMMKVQIRVKLVRPLECTGGFRTTYVFKICLHLFANIILTLLGLSGFRSQEI